MTHADGARGAIPQMNMSNSKKRKAEPADAKTANAKAAKANATDPCSATASTWLVQAEAFARREPTKAVVSAVGAGFLLNLLPIRAILGAPAAVALAVARPALLFLGMLKLWEICPGKKEPKV